jgi:UDP-N-acetylmuramyl pentapeptide phosphotransferase/UDP-N-acetylglucosamine-1-phosphate transferase
MMHPVETFLACVGGTVAFLGFCLALFCSQAWVVWMAGVGTAVLALTQGLDKWREWKHKQASCNWW